MKTIITRLSAMIFTLTYLAGCVAPYSSYRPISLELYPLSNAWLPEVLVRSYDGKGINFIPEHPALGAEYKEGVAILLVKNYGNTANHLRNWTDEHWTLVVRQNESVRRIGLLPTTRSLPSFPRLPIILQPDESSVFVIGMDDERISLTRHGVSIHVEYTSEDSIIYTSNEITLGDGLFGY